MLFELHFASSSLLKGFCLLQCGFQLFHKSVAASLPPQVHGCVRDNLQGLSSLSAASLSLEAEEEKHIFVKLHTSDSN